MADERLDQPNPHEDAGDASPADARPDLLAQTFTATRDALSGAADAISDRMAEIPEDQVLTDMRQMKTLTPEKVKSYADAFARVMEDGLRYSAGGASVIRENSNLFDEILNPFAGEEELAAE